MFKKVFICMVLAFAFLTVTATAQWSFADRYQQGKVAVMRLVDNEICMAVWHDGTDQEDGSAVTAAYFSSVTDAKILCYATGTSVAGLDSNVGTEGVITVTVTNDDTFGKIADAINAAPGWHCQLVDVLRADSALHIASITAVKDSNCYKNAGVTISRDQGASTDEVKTFNVGLVRYGYGKEDLTGWQVFLDAFVIDAVFNDGYNYVEVYICDDVTKTETAVLRTEAAATTVEFWFPTYGPTGFPILSGQPGQRIVIRSAYELTDNPDALSLIGALGSMVLVH